MAGSDQLPSLFGILSLNGLFLLCLKKLLKNISFSGLYNTGITTTISSLINSWIREVIDELERVLIFRQFLLEFSSTNLE